MSQKKVTLCRTCEANGVSREIFFSNAVKTPEGKFIPLEADTKQQHSCPFNKYAKKTESTAPTNNSPEAIGARTPDIQAALTRLETDSQRTRDAVNKQAEQLNRIEEAIAGLLMKPASETPQE